MLEAGAGAGSSAGVVHADALSKAVGGWLLVMVHHRQLLMCGLLIIKVGRLLCMMEVFRD